MVSRIAGKAIESLWSFLGTKEQEDVQPCFDYDGNSDGWLPVYLDGVQVMFHDLDKSTSGILWRADKTELVKIGSDIANRDGVHVRYTTEIDAAWPNLHASIRWGTKVRAESKGSWLFMKGPLGPVPKELWPKARQYWEDLFQDQGIKRPGRKNKDTTTNDEVKLSLDSKSKEPITTD